MPRKIEVSHKTIVFAVLFVIFLWFVYFVKDIILEFFVALLIMAILNPLVTSLSRFRVPRSLSILATYVLTLGILGFAVASILPPLVEQTSGFTNNLPLYFSSLGLNRYVNEQVASQFFSQIGSVPGQLLKIGISTVSHLFTVLFVLVFAFYLLLARNRIDEQLAYFFGEEKREEIKKVIDSLESRLGGWARGELALMFIVGLSNYVGLALLGVPYAISLSILAGILEIVPYVGPILAGALATIIGFSISPVLGLAVAAMAILIQQVENYVFVPKIMEKSVGVNPIITIIALTIGFRLFGLVGVLISVPVVITLQVLSKEYFFSEKG